MSEKENGLLAIWSTVSSDFETDYLHWLTREHVFERVGTPGFRAGSVYRRHESAPSEYLIVYELDDASVMSSAAYRARLDNPTAWTQRVMPRLQHFRRGGGTVLAQVGHFNAIGAHMAVARVNGTGPAMTLSMLDKLASLDRVTRVRMMSVAPEATAISTREKSMRSSEEGTFGGIVAIDALDSAALANAMAVAKAQATTTHLTFEQYDLVFSFSRTVAVLSEAISQV